VLAANRAGPYTQGEEGIGKGLENSMAATRLSRTRCHAVVLALVATVGLGQPPQGAPPHHRLPDAAVAALPGLDIGEQEMVAPRMATTRISLRDDGTLRTEPSPVPLRHVADDGTWPPVDAAIVQAGDGSFVSEANALVCRFPASADGDVVLWRRSDGARLRVRPEGLALRHSDGSVAKLAKPTDVAARLDADDAVVYSDIYRGVAEAWRVSADRVRLEVRIDGPLEGVTLSTGDVLIFSWLAEAEGLPECWLAEVRALRARVCVAFSQMDSVDVGRPDSLARHVGLSAGQTASVRSGQEPAGDEMRLVTEVQVDGSALPEDGSPIVITPTAVAVALAQLAASDAVALESPGSSVPVSGDTAVPGSHLKNNAGGRTRGRRTRSRVPPPPSPNAPPAVPTPPNATA
jgi:hypothetical protein